MPIRTDDTAPNPDDTANPAPAWTEIRAVREVVGLFDDHAALEQAVDELLVSGFDRCEVSLLAEAGDAPGNRAEQLADDPQAPRTDHFCTEALGNAEGGLIGGFAVIPALSAAGAATAVGATTLAVTGLAIASGGAGAVLGAFLAVLLARRRATHHAEQTEMGGQLLWVRTRSPELEQRGMDILARHAAHHVHAHDMPV
ncbi:hypothetical protein ACFQY5_17890 [Paeniroseomonas aquatica]|uniref:DUF1269 domain-containing protein n=1 Tax=Paeniroseomonas aquatica TaxID=373043 RepID=A0ABT8A4V8_9PROT|nr:hypothetical protein [Paeniroseomonas aquatica]MDN3564614.1 hypothetical protein [Paeniroseomonas aquatica]